MSTLKRSIANRLLLIGQVSRILNLSEQRTREIADSGELPCIRDANGNRLFKPVDVWALRKKRGKLPASRRNG